MQLTRLTFYHVRMPLQHPFETSFGRITHRECILVEAEDEIGYIGWGECAADRDPGFSYETTGTAWHILQDFLGPAALQPPLDEDNPAADFQHRVAVVKGHNMAKAGLEMALWDLQGQRLGRPLRDLLGGERAHVPVGVSIGLQPSPEDLVARVGHFLEQGYRRIKIKIKPGRDVVDTQAVRTAFPHILLQVDANSAYTLETAQALKPIDDLDLLLIEQPLAEDDLWEHHKLQTQFHTPLCLDESIRLPRHATQALEMDACRIINIKQGRVGGLHHAVAIHDLAQARDVPVWCGGMLETGIGRAANLALASLPNFRLPGDISATDRYYAEDITHQRFTLNPDGTITVPDAPGLGITVNREALSRYTLRARSLFLTL